MPAFARNGMTRVRATSGAPDGVIVRLLRGSGDRRDVVVRPEEVLRVVLRLDPAEPCVLLRPTEGLDDSIHLVEVEHVDVDAPPGPRLEVAHDRPGAVEVVLVIGRV